jgi:8-oxo-dGTP pyrophosphatase MutT (NUDIX family)
VSDAPTGSSELEPPGDPASGVTATELERVLAPDAGAGNPGPLHGSIAPDDSQLPISERRAAVATIFYAGPSDTEMLFIQRAKFDGDPWSGQMAFPGGRVEPEDPDTHATAERETEEEIGLDLGGVRRLGGLADMEGGRATNRLIQVSAHCYWLATPRPSVTPNYEVADIVWVPISDLLDEGRYIDYRYRNGDVPFPGIQLDHPDQVIWGLTLRFLADLFQRLDRPFII